MRKSSVVLGIISVLATACIASAGTMYFGTGGAQQPGNLFVFGPGTQSIQVLVTGGKSLGGSDLQVIIGTGTSNTAPLLTAMEMAGVPGGIFAASDGQSPPSVGGPGDIYRNITTTTPKVGQGVLAVLTIGITAATVPGDYPIDFGFVTLLSPAATEYPLTTTAATIRVVPEPASALLLLGALPFARRRKMA